MLIPDDYVSNIQERLNLYTKLDDLDRAEELEAFENELRDRFGKVPNQVKELFQGLKLRWVCRELGFDRLILKKNKMRCYFVENAQSPYYESQRFGDIVRLVGKEGKKQGLSLKQSHSRLILIKDGVRTLSQANQILDKLLEQV
jgi:transcription-repair coupling factor (superfamily II helicase)